MRPPSGRIPINRVNVLPYAPAQDAEAGPDPAGSFPAAVLTAVRCSAQCSSAERSDEMGRVSTVNEWTVMVATGDLAGVTVKVNDRLDLLAADGVTVTRSLYANGSLDAAGRGAVTEVSCREVL